MKKCSVLILLAIVMISGKTFAQFSIDGEFRPRFEFRDGFKSLPADNTSPAYLVSQRSRLAMNFTNDKVTTKITFQDVRLWGSDKLKSNTPSTAVHEAWAQVKLCDSLSIRLGRQELVYDNERLLSRNDWSQQGTSHDAAVLKYHYNGWKIDFGSAFNQIKDTTSGTDYSDKTIKGNYKSLNYLWIDKKFNKFNTSLLGIMDGYQKTGTTSTTYLRGTYGLILNYTDNGWSVTGRGFLQSGSTTKGSEINSKYKDKRMDVNAYYANMDISYQLTKKFSVLVGFEELSGQDNNNLDKYSAFNTLYGTNHRFNGNMEYFSGAPESLKNAGLFNPYLKFTYQLTSTVGLKADFHYFSTNNEYYYDSKGKQLKSNGKYLGTEGDLSCNYTMSKEVNLLFGYSYMLGDNALTNYVSGSSKRLGNWAFVQLSIKPNFFKADKK
jgi:hypothetical protein